MLSITSDSSVKDRRFFDQRLGEEVAHAIREQQPLSCLLLDVDHFKQVNDRYGHQMGDRVLMEVAGLIRAQMRGNDVLSRYGGEEFAALLSQTTDEEAIEVAERVRSNIEERSFNLKDQPSFNVTISIGIATLDPANLLQTHSINGEYLVGQADKSLYEAKTAGRNQVISSGNICMDSEWLVAG